MKSQSTLAGASVEVEDSDARLRRIIARDYAYPAGYKPVFLELVYDTGATHTFLPKALE